MSGEAGNLHRTAPNARGGTITYKAFVSSTYGDLSELSTEDLLHRAGGLRERLREQAAREQALPVECRPA